MRSILLALAMLLLTGCSGGPKIAPVTGTVTLDEQPLANVNVTFQPIASGQGDAGPASFATTDAEGKFTLHVIDKGRPPGAIVGKHRVSITTPIKSNSDEIGPPEPLPARYNTATELSFEVPATGSDQANFDLKSQ